MTQRQTQSRPSYGGVLLALENDARFSTAVGFTYKGTWVSGTSYAVNDVVTYNGTTYNTVAVTSTTTAPNTNSTTPFKAIASGLYNRGGWVSGTQYYPGDVVTNTGSSYANLVATASTTAPTAGATWALLAAQGNTGTAGTNGTSPTVGVGTVSALATGSTPTVTASGTTSAVSLNFGIPSPALVPVTKTDIDYTAAPNDLVLVNANTRDCTVTLPSGAAAGSTVMVRNNGAAATFKVQVLGAGTGDPQVGYQLDRPGNSITMVCTASGAWATEAFVGASRWRGTWSNTTPYQPWDLVIADGNLYQNISLTGTTGGVTPSQNAAAWKILTYSTATPVTASTATWSALAGQIVLADCTTTAIAVTLPTSGAQVGNVVTVKKTDSGTNAVTVTGSTIAIEPGATTSLSKQGQTATYFLASLTTGWIALNDTSTASASSGTGVADKLFTPTYTSGNWFSRRGAVPTSATTSTLAPSASTIWYSSFYLSAAVNVSGVGYMTGGTAPTSGSSVRIGVFSNVGGAPGTLLTDFGLLSLGTSGSAVLTTSFSTVSLPQGWVWIAHSFNSTSAGTCQGFNLAGSVAPSYGGIPNSIFTNSANVPNQITTDSPFYFSQTGSSTAAAFGTVGVTTASATPSWLVSSMPLTWLKAA